MLVALAMTTHSAVQVLKRQAATAWDFALIHSKGLYQLLVVPPSDLSDFQALTSTLPATDSSDVLL